MSDDVYSIIAILTFLASVGALIARWRQRVAMKKLLRMLEESRRKQE